MRGRKLGTVCRYLEMVLESVFWIMTLCVNVFYLTNIFFENRFPGLSRPHFLAIYLQNNTNITIF